ncbi:MAG TPA: hypothetical protein VGR89_09295 [Puia sp.]|nr:hypothetical protein [Puia sp.]
MRVAIMPFALWLSVCASRQPVFAQRDTSRLDAGYISLQKSGSQTISRGLFGSNPSDVSDTRRYYTIGGKLSL